MCYANLHVRYQAVQDVVDGRQFLYLVVQEKQLSAAVEFVIDDALDFGLVKEDDLRLDGDAVGRRRLDDGQVPRPQQRKLQGTGNGRSREGERIYRQLELAQLFLGRYPEFLLFVDDQEPQVLEFEAASQDFVRADENVDAAFLEPLLDVRNLFRRTQPAHIFHRAGKILQAGLEGFVMLQGKDGGGHQHRHLLGVADGLERRPDGHFRLAEAHVAADEPVHGAAVLHILFHGLGGALLIRRILVHEGRFQFFLEIGVRREGETLGRPPFGVQLDEFLRNVLYAGFGGRFQIAPSLGTQLVDARRLPFLGAEAGNLVQGMDGHKHHIAPVIHEFHHLVHAPIVIFHFHQTAENTHAMVYMHHEIPDVERT